MLLDVVWSTQRSCLWAQMPEQPCPTYILETWFTHVDCLRCMHCFSLKLSESSPFRIQFYFIIGASSAAFLPPSAHAAMLGALAGLQMALPCLQLALLLSSAIVGLTPATEGSHLHQPTGSPVPCCCFAAKLAAAGTAHCGLPRVVCRSLRIRFDCQACSASPF